MSKAGPTEDRNESSTGRVVLQIVLPLEWDAKEATSPPEESDRPSGAAPPTGERTRRKGKWYSLYDKVFAVRNLRAAWERVRSNHGSPGSDGQSIERFDARLETELEALHEQLRSKRYRPRPVKRVTIPKPGGGKRHLGIPSVRDRVVQQAVLQILGPIFEEKFDAYSHGFRPGRGCQTALRIVDWAVEHDYHFIADADIEKFFDSVDHELLLDRVNEEVSDGSVLRLLRMFLESGVLMDAGNVEPTVVGTPQGGPLSPLLANIYLHPLDVAMREHGLGLVRYADDFIIMTRSPERAEEGLEIAREVLEGLKLRLHPGKTHVATIDEGFDFLGFRYFRDRQGRLQKIVSGKARGRFRDSIRKRTKRRAGQKTRKARRNLVSRLKKNQALCAKLSELSRYLVGWHAYFRDVRTPWSEYFGRDFDGFVRRRVRDMIAGRIARGRWHQLLRNAGLRELGLVSLEDLQRARPTTLSPLRPVRPNLAGAVCGNSARTVRTGGAG